MAEQVELAGFRPPGWCSHTSGGSHGRRGHRSYADAGNYRAESSGPDPEKVSPTESPQKPSQIKQLTTDARK
jgi:hypothetical protein